MAAVSQYQAGLTPSAIFRQAGLNRTLIGKKTPKDCLRRWLIVFKERGEQGLQRDGRTINNTRGRPRINLSEMSEQEKLTYLEAQVTYLKAENAFLAKLRKQR